MKTDELQIVADRSKKATAYQNGNLTIQCIEKKAGACDQVKIRIQNKETGNENR